MPTTSSATFCLVLLLGAFGCSSESTEGGNKGGNGSVLGSGGTASTSGGTATTSGGTASNNGGTNDSAGSNSTAGGNAGSSSGGSSAAQQCIDTPLSCVDSETITGCNPDTLMTETADCGELIMSLGPGLSSEGCQVVEGRSVCAYDYADLECAEGAAAFTACYNSATGAMVDMDNFYFDCFTDFEYDLAEEGEPPLPVSAQTLIRCFTDYISGNQIDCDSATEACFPATDAGG